MDRQFNIYFSFTSVTTDFSDWATNCPEYKVTAVQISPSNGPTEWQEVYEALTDRARRIEVESDN